MGLIELGGWMMWPLLAVSVAALAIVVERALVFMGCPFPDSRFPGLVLEAMRTGDVRPLAARLEAVPSLRDFAALLGSPLPNREAALRLAGETVLERLEARLSLLSVLARLAPLMGLLGTILGMITTLLAHRRGPLGRGHVPARRGDLAGVADHGGGAVHRHSRAVFPVLLSRQGAPRGRRPEQGRKRGSAGRRRTGPHRSGRGGTASARRHSPWGRHGTANARKARRKGPLARGSPEPCGSAPEGREAPQCRDNAGEGLPDGGRSC